MHVLVRCLAALVVASSFVITAAPAAAGPPPPVTYRPPVDAPISDPFRPPSNPYGAGNRGLEYATERGTPVAVAADGTVTFAGVVAGKRWVTIRFFSLDARRMRTSDIRTCSIRGWAS